MPANVPTYYGDSNTIVAVGDVFIHKSYYERLQADPTDPYVTYFKVSKITPKRIYYRICQPDGSGGRQTWQQHVDKYYMRVYCLWLRTAELKIVVKKSGFAKFVKGCDEGKYGKKRRQRRKACVSSSKVVETPTSNVEQLSL